MRGHEGGKCIRTMPLGTTMGSSRLNDSMRAIMMAFLACTHETTPRRRHRGDDTEETTEETGWTKNGEAKRVCMGVHGAAGATGAAGTKER